MFHSLFPSNCLRSVDRWLSPRSSSEDSDTFSLLRKPSRYSSFTCSSCFQISVYLSLFTVSMLEENWAHDTFSGSYNFRYGGIGRGGGSVTGYAFLNLFGSLKTPLLWLSHFFHDGFYFATNNFRPLRYTSTSNPTSTPLSFEASLEGEISEEGKQCRWSDSGNVC